eukprot:4607212-Pleurochrysis_carterae.AAC.1
MAAHHAAAVVEAGDACCAHLVLLARSAAAENMHDRLCHFWDCTCRFERRLRNPEEIANARRAWTRSPQQRMRTAQACASTSTNA